MNRPHKVPLEVERSNGRAFGPAMQRTMLLIALMLVLLALPTGPVHAAPTAPKSRLDQIVARGTLRVGMPGDYLPFALRNKASGAWEGLDVDEARSMAKGLGVKLKIVQTSWSTLMPDLLDGKFDIGAGGVSVTLKRQKTAFFSTPILKDGKTPIARCETATKFGTLADIDKAGVRVITNPGGTNEAFDRTHLHAATIVVFRDNTRIFDELLAGRADVMISDATETRLQHKLRPELCSVHPDRPFDFAEKAYILPRDVALQQWVDMFLHIQQETGALRASIRHWID
jgi:cyclohexadienyl dehydratase